MTLARATVGAALFLVGASAAFAAAPKLAYPIRELGGCASAPVCRTYCDSFKHASACIAYGEGHGLMTKTEAHRARIFVGSFATKEQPFLCKDVFDCQGRCSLAENRLACSAWVKKSGLLGASKPKTAPPRLSTFDTIKNVVLELLTGTTSHDVATDTLEKKHAEETLATDTDALATDTESLPTTSAADDTSDEVNADESDQSGADENAPDATGAASDVSPESDTASQSLDQYRSDLEAILSEHTGPGGCTTYDTCNAYCNVAAHQAACLDFAKAYNLVSPDMAARAQDSIDTPDTSADTSADATDTPPLPSGPSAPRAISPDTYSSMCEAFGGTWTGTDCTLP